MESLQQKIAAMRQSLIDDGTLDGRFEEVENSNKGNFELFVEDTLTVYFEEASKMLRLIGQVMTTKPKEFTELDKVLKELKKITSNVGAKKVRNVVTATRDFLRQENIQGAKEALKQVKTELTSLIAKLKPYFELWRRVTLLKIKK